jgi:hypothetical protein
LIRRARNILTAAGSVAILAGGMALAGATAASAAVPLPSCATGVRCTNNGQGPSAGVAGYYGADDNHTHYRYVQTIVTATPQLVNLNGNYSLNHEGAVGVSLCDPTTGKAAQMSLGYTVANGYELRWGVGSFGPSNSFASDPCVMTGFLHPFPFKHGIFTGINAGDQILLAVYYDPSGHFFHQISFGACDITQGVCRQVWSGTVLSQSFTEFGIGAFSAGNFIEAGAINPLDTFSSSDVTCYSCAGQVAISTVQPVNPFGAGGLYEAQFVNVGSQVQMSPLDSLSGSTFHMWSGSTGPV